MPEQRSTQQVRGRGRPRSADRDVEIRAAAWHIIARTGCAALTFEAIAQHVGCSRSTLYRRYENKAELISHLLDQTAYDFQPQFEFDALPRTRVTVGQR